MGVSQNVLTERINNTSALAEEHSSKVGNTEAPTMNGNIDVLASFYEVYANDNIYDLISQESKKKALSVRVDLTRGPHVEGLKEVAIKSVADAEMVLAVGLSNRHVAETKMNQCSSRSHAVFSLTLKTTLTQKDGQEVVRTSKFTLMDLTGSEGQKVAGKGKGRLKEASSINSSLLSLANVFSALAGQERHIPYRDSKLTFLLRDSLEGKSKVCLLATISPNSIFVSETISTLKFAQRAKIVKNNAQKMVPKCEQPNNKGEKYTTVDALQVRGRNRKIKHGTAPSYLNKKIQGRIKIRNLEETVVELEKERARVTMLAHSLEAEKEELMQRVSWELNERNTAQSRAASERDRLLDMFQDQEKKVGNIRDDMVNANEHVKFLRKSNEELAQEKEQLQKQLSLERELVDTRATLECKRLLQLLKSLLEQSEITTAEKERANKSIGFLELDRDDLILTQLLKSLQEQLEITMAEKERAIKSIGFLELDRDDLIRQLAKEVHNKKSAMRKSAQVEATRDCDHPTSFKNQSMEQRDKAEDSAEKAKAEKRELEETNKELLQKIHRMEVEAEATRKDIEMFQNTSQLNKAMGQRDKANDSAEERVLEESKQELWQKMNRMKEEADNTITEVGRCQEDIGSDECTVVIKSAGESSASSIQTEIIEPYSSFSFCLSKIEAAEAEAERVKETEYHLKSHVVTLESEKDDLQTQIATLKKELEIKLATEKVESDLAFSTNYDPSSCNQCWWPSWGE